MQRLSRRCLIKAAGVSAGILATNSLEQASRPLLASEAETDCLTMQLYKSLSDQQRQ